MGMIYRLDETPVLSEVLDSGDTVTVSIYNKATGAVVPLDAAAATEIGSTGIYRYTVDMTSPPEYGKNTFVYVFTGALQKRYGEFNWNDDEQIFNGRITIDTTSGGTAGTAWPIGSRTTPSDNITDARTIADRYGIKAYEIRGSETLDADHLNWEFHGLASAQVARITIGGYDISGSSFERITMAGVIGGSLPKLLTAVECILDTVTGWDGISTNGGVNVSVALEAGPGAFARFDNMASLTFGGVTINANGLNQIQWGGATGVITVTGFVGGGLLQMAAEAAIVILDAGNVGGVATLGGFMNLTNVSAMTIFLDETLNRQAFRNVMKLAPSAGAPAAGSVDTHLDDILADTDETQSKLPTNEIMGSSDKADHDGEIGDILLDTSTMEPIVSTNLDAAISAVLSAIGSLNNLSLTDVQDAMTAQGFTTLRAALLDNLDASVASVLVAIGALNNLSQADVQAAMTAQGYTSARAAMIELSRKMLTNRLELADGDTDNWILYDDDDSPLLKFNVRDKLGSGIIQPPLFPARRTKGVTP